LLSLVQQLLRLREPLALVRAFAVGELGERQDHQGLEEELGGFGEVLVGLEEVDGLAGGLVRTGVDGLDEVHDLLALGLVVAGEVVILLQVLDLDEVELVVHLEHAFHSAPVQPLEVD